MFKGFIAVFTKNGVTYGLLPGNTIKVVAVNGVRVA